MANVKPFLNKIREAIKGKEVRGSLADGLEVVNKETEEATELTKHTERRQTVVEQQFDNVLSEWTNDRPIDNAETMAAKTNRNTGENFKTIGERLDEENKRVRLDLEQNTDQVNDLNNRVVRPTPTSLYFERSISKEYKGVIYEPDAPIFDGGGLVIGTDENVKLSDSVPLQTKQGMIDLNIIPKSPNCSILYAPVTNGTFELSKVGNVFRFSFGSLSYWVASSQNISVGKPYNIVLRWSEHTKIFEMWVNGVYGGHQWFEPKIIGEIPSALPPDAFTGELEIVRSGEAIVQKLIVSDLARRVINGRTVW